MIFFDIVQKPFYSAKLSLLDVSKFPNFVRQGKKVLKPFAIFLFVRNRVSSIFLVYFFLLQE